MARGRMPNAKSLVKRLERQTKLEHVAKNDTKPKSLKDVQKAKLQKLQDQMACLSVENVATAASQSAMDEEVIQMPLAVDEPSLLNVEVKASNRAFGHHLKHAINISDVVIEVLDARDPEGFRSAALEQTILEKGKRLVLLLNKIDLLDDLNVVDMWEKHLKVQHPVVVFRAMTTASRSKQSTVKFEKGKASAATRKQLKCGYSPLGAADLMGLLSNYTRVEQNESDEISPENPAASGPHTIEKSITVCVVGMPNVGKSSVINSLLRNTNVLKTGNEPGATRQAQCVRLTSKIKLVDTPGVIFDSTASPVEQVLRGTLKDSDGSLTHDVIQHLLTSARKRQALYKYFNLDEDCGESTCEQFLAAICENRKLVMSGGRRDLQAAAKVVIQAWTNGLVPYFELPPTSSATAKNTLIVSTPSKELDLDNL